MALAPVEKRPRGRPKKAVVSQTPQELPRINPWSPATIKQFRAAFEDFISYLKIDSKEAGGEATLVPYGAQLRFLDEVFDGLSKGIHNFVVLKARQLGITTISVALDLFWLFYFPGTKGALTFDKEQTRDEFRVTLDRYIASLPHTHSVPVVTHNRTGMTLGNGSRISYLVAGVKKSAGSGSLGRGLGLSFVHSTEVSSWGDPEGIASLKAALAQKNPNRLYIWESTARGFNDFHEMWEDAKDDDLSSRAIFIGWWAKDDYSYKPHNHEEKALYERYSFPLTDKELEVQKLVKKDYGVTISMEQWAWYRHNKDPNGGELDAGNEIVTESSSLFEQEYPSHEEEAFLLTGANFFSAGELTKAWKTAKNHPYQGYRYLLGEKFTAMSVEQVGQARFSELKIWEEPDPDGVYVIGADPAFGSSDEADRYVIQVLRCYADGVDQVAEFCVTSMSTYQFAWVLVHVCAAYVNSRYLLEITGPGEAVWNEMRNVRLMIENGYLKDDAEEKGIRRIFSSIKQFIYSRADSLGGGGSAWHWKSSSERKNTIFSQLRDAFYLGQLRVRSLECLEEMKKIVQDGLTIKGDGTAKDDRVVALALAVKCWNDWERRNMIAQHRTRDVEITKKDRTPQDEMNLFQQHIMRMHMEGAAATKARMLADNRKGNRWR